jgi:hypothetical protein
MTVYHDLRMLRAAATGLCAEAAVRWVSEYRAPETALHAAPEQAAAMTRHYESGTDIRIFDTIIAPPQAPARSFFTVSHPARFAMQRIADGVQDILGFTPASDVHANREPLGLCRTPLEQSVIDALGLAAEPAWDRIIKRKRVSTADVAGFTCTGIGSARTSSELVSTSKRIASRRSASFADISRERADPLLTSVPGRVACSSS